MSYSLQLRLKNGTYQDAALPETDAGTLAQAFEDEQHKATFDDLSLTLDNTDGAFTALFCQANLPPTDAYPACYGFRVLQDGVPFWEGDLDYSSVEHDDESDTTQVTVTDALARLSRHNAENLQRDYSAIAIVSGPKNKKTLTVNSVLDAAGEAICAGDTLSLGHAKPNGKLATQDLEVYSVDVGTNVITFKKRMKTNFLAGEPIIVKDPWYRGHTASWVLGRLFDLVPGFDSMHRVIDYDGATWSDIIDVADFNGQDVGAAVQMVADWVNAKVFSKVNTVHVIGRGREADATPVKALDTLVGVGSAVLPVGGPRYDLVVIKGREGRQVRKGIEPFNGEKLEKELPFSKDRTLLKAVADRYWDYWGRYREQITSLPVDDDDTAYTLGKRVSIGGVVYEVEKASSELEDKGELSLDLLAETGTLVDPGAWDQDDLVDDDEDPPEPTGLVFTRAYTATWETLFPAAQYPRTTIIDIDVVSTNPLVLENKLGRLYELHWAYPYDELQKMVWRFEVTIWPDGKDREKPHSHLAVVPAIQPDGLYYAKVRLPAGKIWWADVQAVLDDLREGLISEPNNTTTEDDVVGTMHYYGADIVASMWLTCDARPLPPPDRTHNYGADIVANMWMDARPLGTSQTHRYGADIVAAMWLTCDARPLPPPDRTHNYGADIVANMWMDARPLGTSQTHRYGADIVAAMWLTCDARPLPPPDRTHRYGADIVANMWMDARPLGTSQTHRYGADIVAAMWAQGTLDYTDPASSGITVALESKIEDAPGTAAKESYLKATVSSASPLNCTHMVVHATRAGNPLTPKRIDLDPSATSATAWWHRCAVAGEALVVTRVAFWMHHRRVLLTTAMLATGTMPTATKVAGADEPGHDAGTGKPPVLSAPTVTAVAGSGGPHSFEVDVDWSGLTGAEKARIYKIKMYAYHSGWVEKESRDIKQQVLAGVTRLRITVHVAKKLTAGASNYPNVKAILRDFYQQDGAAGYLYGTGDGTTVSNSPQVPALEFYETDNGFLRALQIELTNAVSSPSLAEVLSNCLLTTSNKAYWSGERVVPRPVIVRDGTHFAMPTGVELFNGLILPVWNGAGTAPGWFNLFAYFPRFMGLSAWSASVTYAADDFCYSGTTVYRSKLGSNLNNAVTNTTYWANVGSVPAANKWARFVADGASSDANMPADPSDPTIGTEPPEGGGGCFSGVTYILTADWEAVQLRSLWEARGYLSDPLLGIPVMGYDPNQRNWCVTGAVEVLRHPGKFALLDALGLEVTPDHLCGVSDPVQGRPSRTRWKAAGKLTPPDYTITLKDKAVRCELVAKEPARSGWAKEVFNLRTGTGNFWVSGDGESWRLVHNLKAGL